MGRQNFLTRFPPDRLDPHRGDPKFSHLTEGSDDPDVVTLEIMKNPGSWARQFDDPVFGEAVEPPELPPSFYEPLEEQWHSLAEDRALRYRSPSEVADVSYRLDRRSLGCLRALCTEADFDRLIVTVYSYVHVTDFYRAAAERGQAVIGHSA